jgi:hypothetical protein
MGTTHCNHSLELVVETYRIVLQTDNRISSPILCLLPLLLDNQTIVADNQAVVTSFFLYFFGYYQKKSLQYD